MTTHNEMWVYHTSLVEEVLWKHQLASFLWLPHPRWSYNLWWKRVSEM
jgi:hypothetical protein